VIIVIGKYDQPYAESGLAEYSGGIDPGMEKLPYLVFAQE